MLDCEEYRELRNGERYKSSIERTMSENRSNEEYLTGNSSENAEGKVSEIETLTQEAVKVQTEGFIAPLTRQLEELTRLVLGMVTTPHPSHYPRTDFGTTSGTATHQSFIQRNFSPNFVLDLYLLEKGYASITCKKGGTRSIIKKQTNFKAKIAITTEFFLTK